jgi:sugar lactone lactonase YvrE
LKNPKKINYHENDLQNRKKIIECGVYKIYVHKKLNIMKKLAIIPLAAITFLCSCSKSNNVNPSKTTTPSSLVADSVSLYAGSTTNTAFANGPVLSATFSEPLSLATDASGNVYVADAFDNRIRKITPGGIVSTYAGNGTAGYVDGDAASAEFNLPINVAVDNAGNVYVNESVNSFIRKITPQGKVSTIADGRYGGMAVDAAGNLYAANSANNVITELTAQGVLQVFAGSGIKGAQDGPVATATFAGPQGIAVDAAGNVYVADGGNNLIRKISNGKVTTIAGSGKSGSVDGPAASASFLSPKDLVLDPWGNIYVTDVFKIRKISSTGQVSTLAGGDHSALVNGPALSASFIFAQGLTLTPAGYFLVANGEGPYVLQKITTTIVKQ